MGSDEVSTGTGRTGNVRTRKGWDLSQRKRSDLLEDKTFNHDQLGFPLHTPFLTPDPRGTPVVDPEE